MLMRFFFPTVLCLSAIQLNADSSDHSVRKRPKAHYAGVRAKPANPEKEKKTSSKIKNQWVASKTHPKEGKKQNDETVPLVLNELPSDRPSFTRPSQEFSFQDDSYSERPHSLTRKVNLLELEVEELKRDAFPKTGREAQRGHVYFTGEWLFFRTRQEGMEYATAKKVHFDYTSGFRVGLGVHLPRDGWDIYMNYSNISPEHSDHVAHSTFPLYLYEATNFVDSAQAHWKIEFQSADIEIGRAYRISRTLAFRPYFGLKGAWIDQHAKIEYQGGFIPLNQKYSVHFKNDFKGAGPRIGCQSHWDLGVGFSLFSDAAAALIIGQFDNDQDQIQLDGFKPIDLNTNFHLVSPNVQMAIGFGWDRNFHRDQCHFGLTASFETQVYWSQNQTELFTSPTQPIYIRQDGSLSFYGLTLGARVDF